MTRARIQLQPGFVLARRPFRDTSLLIEIFTPAHGRVGLVARGVRGSRSQRSALLQPMRPLLLSWIESGELGTLTSVDANGPPLALIGERLFCAWYLNELLLNLLQRHDTHPALFELYAPTLSELAESPVEPALRRFELRLLAELGYGLNLNSSIEPGQHYRYDWERGATVKAAADPDTFTGESLIALRDGTLQRPEDLAAARRLLREALRRQLGGRELRTPRLLRELRATAGGGSQESGDGERKR